jgi:hypothetical protein
MEITSDAIRQLNDDLHAIREAGAYFFEHAVREVEEAKPSYGKHDWELLSEDTQRYGEQGRLRLKDFTLRLIEAAKVSPLLSGDDRWDATSSMKSAAAALRLRRYDRWDTEVLHDEGSVLGVRRAGQSEDYTSVSFASQAFSEAVEKLEDIIELLVPGDAVPSVGVVPSRGQETRQYRPNTAFIIMQINHNLPELEDVKNAIKEVFKEYDIRAIRADEIEHQDIITARILEEISTSEFLFADLTGERPSVYYEIGYAHALGKRPILYRRENTTLHFDLAVHNVPEYKNITDLRRMLRRRLATLLNKKVDEAD